MAVRVAGKAGSPIGLGLPGEGMLTRRAADPFVSDSPASCPTLCLSANKRTHPHAEREGCVLR